MNNIAKIKRTLFLAPAVAAMVLVGGSLTDATAQSNRDPFQTAPYAKPKVVRPKSGNAKSGAGKKVKTGPVVVAAPSIQARIDYYKRVREQAAVAGMPIPKVTSVLLLNEMSVTGIFRTPRGFAAMVEATPIKLSYTIYPGEKFFDGQLVAVEENRLVFRKVTKWSNGKFVASVENKALRKYTMQQDIQGTAPSGDAVASKPQSAKASEKEAGAQPQTGRILSPLEEMRLKAKEDEKKSETAKGKSKKKSVSKKN